MVFDSNIHKKIKNTDEKVLILSDREFALCFDIGFAYNLHVKKVSKMKKGEFQIPDHKH